MRQRFSFSRAGNVAVGSSRMSSRISPRNARTISMTFWSAIGKLSMVMSRSMETSGNHFSSRAAARLLSSRLLMMPSAFLGSSPSRIFWAALSPGTRHPSCETWAMPLRSASPALCSTACLPSIVILPAVGSLLPARTLTSVVLPAPFSPIRPWTSSKRKSTLTSSSARVPGYCMTMPERLTAIWSSLPLPFPRIASDAAESKSSPGRLLRRSRPFGHFGRKSLQFCLVTNGASI